MDDEKAVNRFVGVKVFSATMQLDRARLGDRVEQWMAEHPDVEVIDYTTTQSSDHAFHCLSIVLFYRTR
jgi:hypothetical protein